MAGAPWGDRAASAGDWRTWCTLDPYRGVRDPIRPEVTMYGTVAFVRVKPGMEAQLLEFDRMEQAITIPGHVGGYVYRLDSVPNGYVLAIVFESKAAYQANAQSPEQDARYRDMLTFLDGEPDWHDGEIIAAFHRP